MDKWGIQFTGQSLEDFPKDAHTYHETTEQHTEIRKVLRKFQDGYTHREVEKAGAFVDELFIQGETAHVLGTGTGELFLGSEQIKEFIRGDWEYWGDVRIDWENALISTRGETAWFSAGGSVSYSFEDTAERDASYVDFIKRKARESGLSPKQKITFINWALTLAFHQRVEKKREYWWPLRLSGVLLKEGTEWKFVHLHFSIPRANFPDERFEDSGEFLESSRKQNAVADEYKANQVTDELRALLKTLERDLVGQKDISNEMMSRYFTTDKPPYIIGTGNRWYYGTSQMRGFLGGVQEGAGLSLDLDHALASACGEISWVTVTGTLKQELAEEELAERALQELNNLFEADLSSKYKLFAAHRSISYVLKESAVGIKYTCPLRLTAVIVNQNTGPAFHHLHFSFPSYWVLEGKVDGIFYRQSEEL